MNLPFSEEQISENEFIRTFKEDTDTNELKWHRDKEDRIIESIGDTDWELQIDNKIPQKITKNFIPKNTYHRVIKGKGDLKIRLIKIYD